MLRRPSRWALLVLAGLALLTLAPHMSTSDGLKHHFSPGWGSFVWYQYPCTPAPASGVYPQWRILGEYKNGEVDKVWFHFLNSSLAIGPTLQDIVPYVWDPATKKLVPTNPLRVQDFVNRKHSTRDFEIVWSTTNKVDSLTVDTLKQQYGYRLKITFSNPLTFTPVFGPDLRANVSHCGLLSGVASADVSDDMRVWTGQTITGWNRSVVEDPKRGPKDPHVLAWGACMKADAKCNSNLSRKPCRFTGKCNVPKKK